MSLQELEHKQDSLLTKIEKRIDKRNARRIKSQTAGYTPTKHAWETMNENQ